MKSLVNSLHRLKHLALAVIALAAVVVLPLVALAQGEAPDPSAPIGSGWQTFLGFWEVASVPLFGGLGWLLKKLIEWLGSRTDNEIAKRALLASERLRGIVHSGVLAANQKVGDAIRKAKDPSSEGGAQITNSEAQRIKDVAWQSIKDEAGGWPKMLLEFGGVLFGGDQEAMKAGVDTMIESELAKVKAANPPLPRAA